MTEVPAGEMVEKFWSDYRKFFSSENVSEIEVKWYWQAVKSPAVMS